MHVLPCSSTETPSLLVQPTVISGTRRRRRSLRTSPGSFPYAKFELVINQKMLGLGCRGRCSPFSREDFTYDHAGDVYRCPGGKVLTTTGTLVNDGATMLYVATKRDCDRCALKSRCCPKQASRKVPRSIYEGARDMARQIARSREGRTSRRLRKKIEMLFAHLKRILKLDRLRLRGPNGARDEFILAATAQNLRKMAKLIPMPTLRPT